MCGLLKGEWEGKKETVKKGVNKKIKIFEKKKYSMQCYQTPRINIHVCDAYNMCTCTYLCQ